MHPSHATRPLLKLAMAPISLKWDVAMALVSQKRDIGWARRKSVWEGEGTRDWEERWIDSMAVAYDRSYALCFIPPHTFSLLGIMPPICPYITKEISYFKYASPYSACAPKWLNNGTMQRVPFLTSAETYCKVMIFYISHLITRQPTPLAMKYIPTKNKYASPVYLCLRSVLNKPMFSLLCQYLDC